MRRFNRSLEEEKLGRKPSASIWLERCARRINQVDREIDDAEARRLARELHKFERTRAMEPEAAVDFAATTLADPLRAPFERRRTQPRVTAVDRETAPRPATAPPQAAFLRMRWTSSASATAGMRSLPPAIVPVM